MFFSKGTLLKYDPYNEQYNPTFVKTSVGRSKEIPSNRSAQSSFKNEIKNEEIEKGKKENRMKLEPGLLVARRQEFVSTVRFH